MREVALLVDAANVVGARPDGWWRDRPAAAGRLLRGLVPLVGVVLAGPDGGQLRVRRIEVVLEGAARSADVLGDAGVVVHRAVGSGDDELAARAVGGGDLPVLLVTADRGLRARVPVVEAVGPGWLWRAIDEAAHTSG